MRARWQGIHFPVFRFTERLSFTWEIPLEENHIFFIFFYIQDFSWIFPPQYGVINE